MEDLHCNNLRCRKSLTLEHYAVVTTCSHIFCLECANASFSTPAICPCCDTALPDADDVVQANLRPDDAYRTSILSGLAPPVILDIASRALNFWTYQVQQEAAFKALVTKNAQEGAQINSVTREANSEISLLKERLASSDKDLELERRKTRELQDMHKANAKAYTKLKTQYDKAKQRALLHPSDPNLQSVLFASTVNSPMPTSHPLHPSAAGPQSTSSRSYSRTGIEPYPQLPQQTESRWSHSPNVAHPLKTGPFVHPANPNQHVIGSSSNGFHGSSCGHSSDGSNSGQHGIDAGSRRHRGSAERSSGVTGGAGAGGVSGGDGAYRTTRSDAPDSNGTIFGQRVETNPAGSAGRSIGNGGGHAGVRVEASTSRGGFRPAPFPR
ncbi:hypothetical protein JCM10212_004613 [Sporobolomyces blumeae]